MDFVRIESAFHSVRLRTKVLIGLTVGFLAAVVWVDLYFSRLVDRKLQQGPFAGSLAIYAASRSVEVGDAFTRDAVVAQLRQSGYTESDSNRIGHYRVDGDAVDVFPGEQSYFSTEPATLKFRDGHITDVLDGMKHTPIESYSLEPQPIATLDAGDNGKRRLVAFPEIPKNLVNALLAIEDKHFFAHPGFDPMRIIKSAYVDIKSARKEQGGSTLTMQLARNLYLDADKSWRRKASELAITLVLEQKLSKEKIFELYANQVYLGRHYGFTIKGFGEAAHVFFRKDLSQITLPEAALLAGLVQRPSYFDPVNHVERATERRNVVLAMMEQNAFITADAAQAAEAQPVKLAPPAADSSSAPYFLALATNELQSHLNDTRDASLSRVYTTLDLELQHAAVEAVQMGIAEVDKRLAHRKSEDDARPQVALLALDPHTGEVRAAVGGRNFAISQVNHILSKRQPGSVFKPFVYAAALSPGKDGATKFTPASTVVDEPTTFRFGNATYQPGNFGEEFHGRVTLRNALAKSMNVAAVRVAEQIGYRRVVDLAKAAGINNNLQPTPALALGAYEATPLEMAGAYTVFANQGEYVQPSFVTEALSSTGKVAYRDAPARRRVLETPVAFVMQDMLQEVLRSGTAASVRSRGLTVDAAGKTGTSRDGWFAGFTGDLLCIVWVGYDDNRDLDLEGAKSALPIWAEFMKRASQIRQSAAHLPGPPPGVVSVAIDPTTGLRAGPDCLSRRNEFFVEGTAPTRTCSHDFNDDPNFFKADMPALPPQPDLTIPQEVPQ